MKEQHIINNFDNLCEKYSTWIIKYCSPSFELPLFLVWYTDNDENRTDRLLTFKSGKIIGFRCLLELKDKIITSIDDLSEFENLNSWLESITMLKIVDSCVYNLFPVLTEINNNNLDINTLENYTNFVNLFGDFIYQDKRNKHLKIYTNNKIIREVWNYYYNYIFWPSFNDKKKFESWERPKLEIDNKKLINKLKLMIKKFDSFIEIV